MSKISTIGSLPTVHNFEQKKSNPLQFPIKYHDIPVLHSTTDGSVRRFNWKALKGLNTVLKFAQIIASIVIVVLTQTRRRRNTEPLDSLPEISFIFLAINTLMVTTFLLCDSVIRVHPLRRAFTLVLRNKVELWFTGLAAVAFHTLAFSVLMMTFNYYNIEINQVAAAFGFINAALYFLDWCMNFNKRHTIVGMLDRGEIDADEQEGLLN